MVAQHIQDIVAAVHAILRGLSPVADDVVHADEPTVTPGTAAREHLQRVIAHGHRAAEDAGELLPDQWLQRRFELTDYELCLVWWLTAAHVAPELRDATCRANDDLRRPHMDLSLCTRAFCSEWAERMELRATVSPSAGLHEIGLIRNASTGASEVNEQFRALLPGEHLPPFLMGVRTLSASAQAFARWIAPELTLDALGDTDSVLRERVAIALQNFGGRPTLRRGALGAGALDVSAGIAVVFQGADGSGRTTATRALAGTLGRHAIVVEGRALEHAAPQVQRDCVASVLREAELFGDLVCVRDATRVVAPGNAVAAHLALGILRRRVAVVFCVEPDAPVDSALERVTLLRHTLRSVHGEAAVTAAWRRNLPPRARVRGDGGLEGIADRVHLNPLQIRKASQLAYLLADPQDGDDGIELSSATLETAARAQVPRSIGQLAMVTEPTLTMDDLVVDEATQDRIQQVISAAKHRRMVLEEWGIGRRISRGTGIVTLFDGEPGTGKTHGAEVIAGALGLSLVRINVSSVVDKYIGETQKNLTRIFDQARPDVSLLLFDEADSLFSKRTTQVERAADRYSNMDINVMLQLIERYSGVTILTTNLKQAIDKAFERRFTFKVNFPVPEFPERVRLWRYLLPEDITTSGPINYDEVADIPMSGGEIKNAILAASYAASRDGSLLTTEYLVQAAENEAAGAGRTVRRRRPGDDW